MSRTAVISLYHDNYQPLADLVLPNWREYCTAQGYDLKVHCGQYGAGGFGAQKMRLLYDEMFVKETVDLAWVIDLDILITNHTLRIEDFTNGRDTYYLCLEPWGKVNHGSFIVVKSPSSKRLIEFILSKIPQWCDEQTVVNVEIYNRGKCAENSICLLSHPSINSLICDLYGVDKEMAYNHPANWTKGHLALHLAGLALEARLKIFKDLMADAVIHTKEEAAAWRLDQVICKRT